MKLNNINEVRFNTEAPTYNPKSIASVVVESIAHDLPEYDHDDPIVLSQIEVHKVVELMLIQAQMSEI
jgi:hypothetical protein